MKKIKFISVLVLLLSFSALSAQETLKSTQEEYYDFLSLSAITIRPYSGYRTLSDNEWTFSDKENTKNLWNENTISPVFTIFESENKLNNWLINEKDQKISLKIYGPSWYNSYNTDLPYGQNDGALWQGKGYNTSFTAGLRLEAYGLELTFKPLICFSQNQAFNYLPSSYENKYGYFWGYETSKGVDLVQRYGDKAFWTFDWGDTEVRYSWQTFTVGFGTQSPWLGPAYLNPMLGSNNAATYPKFDFGFRKTSLYLPWDNFYLGDFEMRIWLGYLSESQYFDSDSSNDHNMVTGFNISFAPFFIPGFTFGATKICLNKWSAFDIKYLNPFYHGNSVEDQKASIYVDWLLPKAGFEVYGELGIDDYAWCILSNPFHTMIYTLGIKQNIPLPDKNFSSELIFEWNNFEMSQDFQLQWNYMGYYSHNDINQGYTNKGQIIGAGTGYYGNSQYLAYKVYYPKGSSTIFVHRSCPEVNYCYNKAVYDTASSALENAYHSKNRTYLTVGLSSAFFITKNLVITGEADEIFVKFYEYKDNSDMNNLKFSLQVEYNF